MPSVTTIILTNGSFWLPFVLGLIFLVLPTPSKKIIGNPVKIKCLISATYFLYALVSLNALYLNPDFNFCRSIRVSVPLVALFHIILFSRINILIVNKPDFSAKFTPFFYVFTSLISGVYLFIHFTNHPGVLYSWVFYTMHFVLVIYTGYYTFIFFRYYRKVKLALENFYSSIDDNHLKWVKVSQVLVAIMAIFVILTSFIPDYTMVPFMTLALLFYTYYAFRLIRFNYSAVYQGEEFGTEENFLEDPGEVPDEIKSSNGKPSSIAFTELENAVERWINEKKYLETDITIISVANELSTNRTYLSYYINNFKQQTFKEWISELRVEEAKRLLISEPNLSISEISMIVGFTDRSNFSRKFSNLTGKTPCAWRNVNIKTS